MLVQRSIAILILILGLFVQIVVREPKPVPAHPNRMFVAEQATPDPARVAAHLGPLRLEKAWQISGPEIGGYSSLLPTTRDSFLTLTDDGRWLAFRMNGGRAWHHAKGRVHFRLNSPDKEYNDVESAVRDPRTGTIWLGMEGVNAISRTDSRLHENARVEPKAMAGWGFNSGPESLIRLRDGRFVTIQETPRGRFYGDTHDAVIFAGDPITHPEPETFRFKGPPNFSVVDMAALPDGRILILMRRFVWPFPMHFAGRIAIADPAAIRAGGLWEAQDIAALSSDLPVDNFEGIAVTPSERGGEKGGEQGRVNVWIISDDNFMHTQQRTLLWKMSVDPAQLPWPGRVKR